MPSQQLRIEQQMVHGSPLLLASPGRCSEAFFSEVFWIQASVGCTRSDLSHSRLLVRSKRRMEARMNLQRGGVRVNVKNALFECPQKKPRVIPLAHSLGSVCGKMSPNKYWKKLVSSMPSSYAECGSNPPSAPWGLPTCSLAVSAIALLAAAKTKVMT